MNKKVPQRILVIAGGGGHIDEAVSVLPAFRGARIELVTYRYGATADLSAVPVDCIHRVALYGTRIGIRLIISLCIINVIQLLLIFLKYRPQVVFSTGSELAIPAFLIAKLFYGTKTIHLETIVRINDLSQSGRILKHLADVFYVQWPGLSQKYLNETTFAGRVI